MHRLRGIRTGILLSISTANSRQARQATPQTHGQWALPSPRLPFFLTKCDPSRCPIIEVQRSIF